MNKIFIVVIISFIFILSGCSTKGSRVYKSQKYKEPIKSYPANGHHYSNKVNNRDFLRLKMKPYVVRGKRYNPIFVDVGDKFNGYASWYGPDFHGKLTCNGEKYDMHGMTAAHKTLPMNTMVKVTNKRNGLSTIVRVNDRGPFVGTRIIDLSKTAAKKIDMIGTGTAPVELEIVGVDASLGDEIKKTYKKKIRYSKKKILPKRRYALQIASFSNIDGAIALQEKYNNKDGYKTIIKDIDNDGMRYYKVLLRGFKTENEIRDYKSDGHFKNAFIVRED